MPKKKTLPKKTLPKKNVTFAEPQAYDPSSDSDDSGHSGASFEAPIQSSDSESSDDETPIIKPTKRMTMPKKNGNDIRKMDAPTDDEAPNPLLSEDQMMGFHRQVQPEGHLHKTESGASVFFHLPTGIDVSMITITRFEDDKSKVKVSWPAVIKDSAFILETFCSGDFVANGMGGFSEVLQLSEGSAFMSQILKTMDKINVSERIEVQPKSFVVIDFERPIKSSVCPNWTTTADGKSPLELYLILNVPKRLIIFVHFTFHKGRQIGLPGMYDINGILVFTVEWEDADATVVNRVHSPMR
jgi:hypothetical protein